MDSLWAWFFPGVLIDVFGLLVLPVVALLLLGFVIFAVFKYRRHRAGLILFLGLTVLAWVVNYYGGRPRADDVLRPLCLMAVMVLPVGVMIFQMYKARAKGALLWGLVSLAGWAYALGWALWIYAMAKS